MRQVTVNIPDEFYESFMTYLKETPSISIETESENGVPYWQQELVFNRIKNSKPEDYISWEESKKRLNEKWLKNI
jgi:hypothetical protein